MAAAKDPHFGGEGTLVGEDDVIVGAATAAICDDGERRGVLKWYARVACLSVMGSVVLVASIPGILNAQLSGDVGAPTRRSALLLGVLGGVAYLSIALFSKCLPTYAKARGHRPQLALSLAGQAAATAVFFVGGLLGGGTTDAGVTMWASPLGSRLAFCLCRMKIY